MNKKLKAALAGLAFVAGCEIGIAIQLAKMIRDYTIKEKIETVAKEIYGADGVIYDDGALKSINEIESLNPEYIKYPVCIAKTQYSLSDDMKKLGRPRGFNINVREVRVSSGAGFIVVITGAIMTMPGLPRVPAAENIDVDDDGKISGLF